MAIGAMTGIAVLLEKAKEYNLPANLCFGDWPELEETGLKGLSIGCGKTKRQITLSGLLNRSRTLKSNWKCW